MMSDDIRAAEKAKTRALARSLQERGQLHEAVEALSHALQVFPEDEQFLEQLFSIHIAQNKWESAAQAARALIEAAPSEPEHHFRLGKAFAWQGSINQASEAYRTGLALVHSAPFEDVISRIVAEFPAEISPTRSTYKFAGGAHNLGSILHEAGDSAFITKISVTRATTERELTFYGESEAHLSDDPIAPRLVHSLVIDGIAYLTIERLAPLDAPPPFKDVVQLANKIATPTNLAAFSQHRNAKASAWLLRPTTVIHRFCEIHQKKQNEYLLDRARELAELQTEPDVAKDLVESVAALIVKNSLYQFLDPETHYGLVHGDFVPSNMGRHPESGELLAFDWSAFRHGPKFLNAVHFAAIAWAPYSEFRNEYLFHAQQGGLSTIEQIFALYAYILVQLNRKSDYTFAHRMRSFMSPALEDLQQLVDAYKCAEFASLARQWSAARDEVEGTRSLEAKVKTLEKQNQKLTRELSATRNQLDRLTRSTSWRVTAPLRGLGGLIKKLSRRQTK